MQKYLTLTVLLFIATACQKRGYQGVPGPKGSDGVDGNDGVIEVINPCGAQGNYEEILLKLNDGRLIAVFDGGPHEDRLVILPFPNTYSTTDGFSCVFSLDEQGNLVQ